MDFYTLNKAVDHVMVLIGKNQLSEAFSELFKIIGNTDKRVVVYSAKFNRVQQAFHKGMIDFALYSDKSDEVVEHLVLLLHEFISNNYRKPNSENIVPLDLNPRSKEFRTELASNIDDLVKREMRKEASYRKLEETKENVVIENQKYKTELKKIRRKRVMIPNQMREKEWEEKKKENKRKYYKRKYKDFENTLDFFLDLAS